MPSEKHKSRKWERYACLISCRIIPENELDMSVPARIINIGRGGMLIEADYDFGTGTRVIVATVTDSDVDRFAMVEEVHGTVRWGQLDASSLMGLFYVGVEFDELLPFKQAMTIRG